MVFIAINALYVSGGSFVHHQELKTYTQHWVYVELEQLTHDSDKKQIKLDKYPMLCILFRAPDDGRRNRLKHVEHL